MSDKLNHAFDALINDLDSCATMEALICGKTNTTQNAPKKKSTAGERETQVVNSIACIKRTIHHCSETRKRNQSDLQVDTSDTKLSKLARFTDCTGLKPFQAFLQYVPRLVNVVTLAEAIPVRGSGVTLPLDLAFIASRCSGAYFAPKRFSAVQLAYTNPRARVLIFRTRCTTNPCIEQIDAHPPCDTAHESFWSTMICSMALPLNLEYHHCYTNT